MSLPGPPQLHLSIPTNATSFKRNFEQFGLDLDDGPSPIVDSPHSDLDGQGRNKRARSEASFASVASASSSSSASGSSVTMASIRSPGESAAGPESESSMEGDGDLEALPSPASVARSVHADSHNLPPVPPQASSSTATTATAINREMAAIIAAPPRLSTPQIDEIVMESMELDVPVPVSAPHTHSSSSLTHLLNHYRQPPTAESSHHVAPPSQEERQREREDEQDAFTRSLAQFAAFDTNIAALRRPLSFSLSHTSIPTSTYSSTSTTTNSTPPRLPTPRIHTPPPTLTLPPLVGSRLTLDLGSISGADRDRGLDHGPSATGDSNSNSDLDLDLESDLDDWEIVQGERVQMNGNRDPEGRERNGNEGTGHLAEGAASQLALMMGNEVRGDTSLTSGSGSNNNISGNTGSSSTTPTPTSASVSEGRFDSVYDYPYTAPRRQGEPLVAGGTAQLPSSTSSTQPVTSSARQANPRIGSGAESGAWGMTASSYVPTVRNYYWSIADDRERERRVEFDADGVERRRREGDLDLEFLERERRREMERETQRGREGGREGEGDRRDVIPGEGDFAAHLNTALRRLREETSLFTEVVGMELTRERERGRERDRERERETGQRGRDGVGPPRIPPLPSLMHSGRDMSPLFASTPTSTERDETVSTNATRASSSASTARTSTGHHRSDSLDSLGLSMEVPFDGPSNRSSSSGSGFGASSERNRDRDRDTFARPSTATNDNHNINNNITMTHNPVPRRPISSLHSLTRRPTPLGPRSASRNGSGSGLTSANLNASASGPARLPEVRVDTEENVWRIDSGESSENSSGSASGGVEERSSAGAGDYFSLARMRTPWYTQSPVNDSSPGMPAEQAQERRRLSSDGDWSVRRPPSLLTGARMEEGYRISWRSPSATAGIRTRPVYGTAIGPRPSSSHGPRPLSSAAIGAATTEAPRISMDLGLDSSDDSLDIFLSDSNNSQEHPTSVSSSSTTTIATATATGRQAGHSSASRFRNPTPTGPSHANGGHYPPSSFNYNRFVPGHRRTSSENSTIPAMNVSVSRPRLSSNSLVSENASELGSQLARSHIRQQQLEGRREDWADNESTTAETSRNLVYPRRPRAQINRTLNPPRLATPPSNIRPSTSARHSAHPERPASTWEDHVAIADDNRLASEREVGRAGDSHNHGRGSLWYSRPPSPVRHGVRRRAPRDESNSNISLPSFFHSQNGAMFLRNPPSARIDATYGTLNRSSTYERRQRRDSDSSMEVDDEQLSPNHDFIPALPTPDLGDGFNQSSSLGFYSSSTRQPQVSAQVNREGQFDNYFRFEPFLSRSQDRVLESGRPSNSAQEPARRAPPTGGPLSSLDPYSFHPGPFRNTIQYMREMGGPRNTTANPPPSLPPLSLDDSNFSHSIMGNSPVLLSRIPSDSQARRSSRGVQPSPQHSEPSPVEGERATAMQHRLPIEELHMIPDADDFRDLYNESHHQHHHYHHYRNSSPRRSQPSDNVRERPGMPLFRNLDTRFFARAPTEHVPLPVFGHSRRPVRDRRRPGGDYVRDEDFDPSYEALLSLSDTIGDAKPRGIPESVIEGLETGSFKEWQTSDGDKRCPICLEDYAQEDMLMKLSECSHWMHRACLHQWLKAGTTCPVCRKSVTRPSSPRRCTRPRNVFGPRSRHGPNDRRPDDGNHIHPPFFI